MSEKFKGRRQYSKQSLAEAIQKIRANTIGIRQASREYKIPRGTLQDRLSGRVLERPEGVKMGPPTVLSYEEETKIVNWLINSAKCGFPRSREELLQTVQKILKEDLRKTPFRDSKPGKTWYYNFLKRHPNLSLRTPEGISKSRSAITEREIRKWFCELQEYLIEQKAEDILKDPSRILNGDETSFSMSPKTGNVIAPKGWRNVYQVQSGNDKETLTVLLLFTACGKTLPPMVVFPYLRPPANVVNSMPDEWILGRSESGWMRSETFYEYVANGLNNWITKNNVKRPVLLFVDGHKSHMSIELSNFCSSNQIILYALPPNTTHILQPADVGVFKSLKSDYKNTIRAWHTLPGNHGKAITKQNFCKVLNMVLKCKDRKTIVQNAFRKCGLFPFNPDAVDYTKCVMNLLEKVNEINTSSTSSISDQGFLEAKRLITSVKDELAKINTDYKEVINIIQNSLNRPAEIDDTSYSDRDALGPSNIFQDTCTFTNDGNSTSYFLNNEIDNQEDFFSSITLDPIYEKDNVTQQSLVHAMHIDQSSIEIISNGDTRSTNVTLNDNQRPSEVIQFSSDIMMNNISKETAAASDTACNNVPLMTPFQSSFNKHLFYPKPIMKSGSTKGTTLEKPPMSISSEAWKIFFKKKEQSKADKAGLMEGRKLQRLKQREDKLKKKSTARKCKKKTVPSCPTCNVDVLADVEMKD